jgi:caa(3)-type oxidase subunit IV
MSAEHSDTSKLVKKYMMVFGALIIGTILTVAVAWIHIPSFAAAVLIGLFIATVKGTLVALYFMHLSDEKRAIYNVLLLAAVFIVFMVGLILWTEGDQQIVKERNGAFSTVTKKQPAAHGKEHSEKH